MFSHSLVKSSVVALALSAMSSLASANPRQTYELKITNGGAMPLSPAVIYALEGQEPVQAVGDASTAGLQSLCQRGDATTRLNELMGHMRFARGTQTSGLIMPGESRTITVSVEPSESLHFEVMYGKTKETCGVIHLGSADLPMMRGQIKSGTDLVIEAGAFSPAAVPAGDPGLDVCCANQKDGVSCLRGLAQPVAGEARVRAFVGTSPRLLPAIEAKYGNTDAQSLIVPTSGAIHYQLKKI